MDDNKDIKVQNASSDVEIIEAEIIEEGISDTQVKEFQILLKGFLKSYSSKSPDVNDEEWLKQEFQKEMPHLMDEEAAKLSAETTESIKEFDENLASINKACDNGASKNEWFSNKVTEAATGASVIAYGNYLQSIDTAITNANAQMIKHITTKAGDINQNFNLDGFIAEQHHVNSFNMQAVLQSNPLLTNPDTQNTLGNSPLIRPRFIAEIPTDDNQAYALNSFDIVIKDTFFKNKIVHQYQCKFGADAETTIALIKDGNYDNQRLIVPAEQVEAVKKAFPGKSVEAYIGGTDIVPVKSIPLTKQQAKDLQLDAQQKNSIPSNDWNNYNTLDLVQNIGKNAALIGVSSAVIVTGFNLAAKVMSGEKIESDQVIKTALTTGADTGIKAAAAGAIKVGSERGIIAVIPKGTPIGVITTIACVGIENIKIMGKVGTGELTVAQGIDQMGRTSTAMVFGLSFGAKGAFWGAAGASLVCVAILGWIPIVGPIVGGIIGGIVGYTAGSTVGNAVYSGLKAVGSVAKAVAKGIWGGIKSGVKAVANFVGNTVKSIGNAISRIFG